MLIQGCDEPRIGAANEGSQIKLGNRLKNPFTTENIRQAFSNVLEHNKAKRAGRTTTSIVVPSTTHNYVKFAPQNMDQLLTLLNYGYELSDVPLDQDLVTAGDYYIDPTLPVGAITYQYTLVPVNYSLPTTVPYQIISEVLLFDEDAGDEADPDVWIPDPDPNAGGYCYDGLGAAYVCGSSPRQYLRENQALPEDLYKKATKNLIDQGIDLTELYNEAMRLAGMDEEIIPINSEGGRVMAFGRYYPKGYVRVYNTLTGQYEPVKNATVKAWRLFKWKKTAQTGADGYFNISTGFRLKANIEVQFKNDEIKVFGLNGAVAKHDTPIEVSKGFGKYNGSALENLLLVIPNNSDPNTYGGLQWAAAQTLNAYFDMKTQSVAANIIPPFNNLNAYIFCGPQLNSSATMLRSVANDLQTRDLALARMWDGATLPNLTLPVLLSVLQRKLPDITLRIKGSSGTTINVQTLNTAIFKELAHTQHYKIVGDSYWASAVSYIAINNGFATKATQGSHAIAVMEAWGYFIANTFTKTKYSTSPTISNASLNFLEFQKRDDNVAVAEFNGSVSRGWIPWGMLHDLTDSGEPAITLINDQVSGYTIYGISKGLGSGSLSFNILYTNNNNQSIQVNALAASYGY